MSRRIFMCSLFIQQFVGNNYKLSRASPFLFQFAKKKQLTMEELLGLAVALFIVAMGYSVYMKRQVTLVEPPVVFKYTPRGYTEEELASYKGTGEGSSSKDVFLSCKGVVFHVAASWYGPEGPYHAFAGVEASRHLGKTVVGTEEANADWSSLAPMHLNSLEDWFDRFSGKYTVVGWFLEPDDYVERASKFKP